MAQIKVTTGTSICAQIEIYEFTNSGRIGGRLVVGLGFGGLMTCVPS